MSDSENRLRTIDFLVIVISTVFISLLILFLINSLLKTRPELPFNRKPVEELNVANFNLNRDKIDTVILGDSHPGQSLVNLLPTNWLKATHPGEDLESSLLKFEYFVNNSNQIKYLVLPLDYHSLNGSWGVPKQEYDIYRKNLIADFFKVNKLFDDYNRKIAVNWLFSKLNDKFFKLELPQNKPVTGWEEITEGDRDLQEKIEIRAKGMLHYPIIDDRSVAVMARIFEISKENNIKLIGVRYPLPNDFIKYVKDNKLDRMDDWIEKNKSMFFRILDYREIFKDHQEYFGNEDHLNIPGSAKFTSIFVQEYFESVYDYNEDEVENLPTVFPKVNKTVSVASDGVYLLNIESPYGVEQDNERSWFWLGIGQKEGISVKLYSKTNKYVTLKIEFENPTPTNLLFTGEYISVQEQTDSYLTANMYLDQGVNEISFYVPPTSEKLADTPGNRNLILKINVMKIEDYN